jgi:hypothetical protein
MLRRVYGSKEVGMTGVWRNLHNEDLHNSYSSSYIVAIISKAKCRFYVAVLLLFYGLQRVGKGFIFPEETLYHALFMSLV